MTLDTEIQQNSLVECLIEHISSDNGHRPQKTMIIDFVKTNHRLNTSLRGFIPDQEPTTETLHQTIAAALPSRVQVDRFRGLVRRASWAGISQWRLEPP
jgi:hypothetical protein